VVPIIARPMLLSERALTNRRIRRSTSGTAPVMLQEVQCVQNAFVAFR
jgi:hypothetical protein